MARSRYNVTGRPAWNLILLGDPAAGKATQGKYLVRRYPLLFALLLAFGTAAIFTGFHFWVETTRLFHEKPLLLVLLGVIVLFLTGTLYKTLSKDRH